MKTIHNLLLAGFLGCSVLGASAQGTAFTYQGRLHGGDGPANGSYDLTFSLFDALVAGAQQGVTITNLGTVVSNGLFALTLDFGNQFPGENRWLEIGVRTNGAEAFAILEPRQALTATPYAITAGGVSTGAPLNASSLNSGTVGDARLSTNVALRAGGNTFSGDQVINGDQTVNGVFNLNTAPYPGVTAFLRARPGDNLPLAVQGTNGVNLLLVFTNGQANVAGDLFVGGRINGGAAVLSGNFGIGTPAPSHLLQVGSAATANSQGMIAMASRSGDSAAARIWELGVPETDSDVTGPGYSFVINDTQNGPAPELMVKYGTGNVGIGTTNPATRLDVAGEVTCTAVNVTSDRNAKEDFTPVNARLVLEKVVGLPITEWHYRTQKESRHIGPMAQDFRAAFGLGRDEKHITSVDADGVALAAIQGLNAKLEEQVRAKEARILELEKAVAELKALMGVGSVRSQAR